MTWTPDEPFSTCESLGETQGGTRNLPGFLCSLLRPGPVLILGSSEIALEASRSHEVIVVDWNRRRLAKLQECFHERGQELRALCRDPERQDLGVGGRSVSNVICVDVLERFHDDVTVLEQLHRTLAPRGRLIVRVRTRTRVGAEPGADLLSVPRVYAPELLRDSLQEAGYRPLSMRYWNFLGASDRSAGNDPPGRPNPWRDRALDLWFRAVENRVGFPTGTSLVSVAEPRLEKASVRQPLSARGLSRRAVREAYEPMALLR